MPQQGEKNIIQNRRARHEYFIEESYEAGIALLGTEVKSLRLGKANLTDAYAQVREGELILHSLHISPYDKGNLFNHDPLRERRLLMHKREIRRLRASTQQKGYSLIPLRLYLKNGIVKVELGLARGKKLYDKRADDASASARRDMEQAYRRQGRGD